MQGKKCYLGIDPGLDGSFAVVSDDQIRYKLVMPLITTITNKGKIKKEIDRNAVLSFLSAIPPPVRAVIEEQIPVRNQRIQGSHTLAKNYGILLMGLTAAQINYTEVPSDVWQSHFGIAPITQREGETTKEQALEIAQMLYPDTDFRKSDISRKAHDGIVDATLIANYCQFLFKRDEK